MNLPRYIERVILFFFFYKEKEMKAINFSISMNLENLDLYNGFYWRLSLNIFDILNINIKNNNKFYEIELNCARDD